LAAAYRLIVAFASSADSRRKMDALGTLRQLIDELPPAPMTFLKGASGQPEGTDDSKSAVPPEK
jgi:hypothetical protein